MRSWACLILGLLAGGCGGSGDSGTGRPPVRPEPVQPSADLSSHNAGQGALSWDDRAVDAADEGPAYNGLTVQQWSQEVNLPNATPGSRHQAIQALARLGDVGYRELIKAAQHHPSPETRVQALQAIEIPYLTEPNQQKQTVPIILAMMRDQNHLVRQAAAMRLAWFDHAEGDKLVPGLMLVDRIRVLEFTAANDPSPYVRQTASDSLQAVLAAQKGMVVSD